MLGILGLILKIILWIILGILLLLLSLILIILLVPIRYDLKASKCLKIKAKGKVSYLFGLIRVYFDYVDDEAKYIAKVLYFTVASEGYETEGKPKNKSKNKSKNKQKNTPKNKQKNKPKNKPKQALKDVSVNKTVNVAKPPMEVSTVVKPDPTVKEIVRQEIIKELPGKKESKAIKESVESKETKKPTENKKEPSAKKDVNKKTSKKKSKKGKLDDESSVEKAKRFYKFLKKPENKGVFKYVLKMLFRMIKSLLPKKFEGKINFGTDDPSTTGYILALASVFYPLYDGKLTLTPDFEGPRLEGYMRVKGRIIIGIIVYYGLRIIIDRRVRRLIKEARK